MQYGYVHFQDKFYLTIRMTKYSVDVNGIHCDSCRALIKMELEEIGICDSNFEGDKLYFGVEDGTQPSGLLEEVERNLKEYAFTNLVMI